MYINNCWVGLLFSSKTIAMDARKDEIDALSKQLKDKRKQLRMELNKQRM
jgi:hypothetical protein